jgi:hypothetical protein
MNALASFVCWTGIGEKGGGFGSALDQSFGSINILFVFVAGNFIPVVVICFRLCEDAWLAWSTTSRESTHGGWKWAYLSIM